MQRVGLSCALPFLCEINKIYLRYEVGGAAPLAAPPPYDLLPGLRRCLECSAFPLRWPTHGSPPDQAGAPHGARRPVARWVSMARSSAAARVLRHLFGRPIRGGSLTCGYSDLRVCWEHSVVFAELDRHGVPDHAASACGSRSSGGVVYDDDRRTAACTAAPGDGHCSPPLAPDASGRRQAARGGILGREGARLRHPERPPGRAAQRVPILHPRSRVCRPPCHPAELGMAESANARVVKCWSRRSRSPHCPAP